MMGVIGDMHLREKLGYADYLPDKRIPEKEAVLKFIRKKFEKCDSIVFVGDQLNSRNNISEVIRGFVQFVETFNDKKVYILAGNHEKKGDGKSAIDFMREIDKPNWTIITDDILVTDMNGIKGAFCPYFYKTELEVDTNEKGAKKLMKKLEAAGEADIIFHHHAVTDTTTEGGTPTSIFDEIVLSRKALEKKYKLVVGGHVHKPQIVDKTIVTGSVFTHDAGEVEKSIYIIDEKTLKVETINLPVRPIYKLVDPTEEEIGKLSDNGIAKVELKKKLNANKLMALKELLEKKLDAYVLLENYEKERKKVHFEEGMLDFSIENLLIEYAKQNKIPKGKLLTAWETIK